ncbi:phage tail protein [Oceanisphaera arctica]|nr:phage tail protein [Oceanisphaera arctica]GHA05540.1 hypothetical protein GCM10007082_03120 [Oceanisphaera arctica]
MTNQSGHDIEIVEGRGFALPLVLEAGAGQMGLTGYRVSAQIRQTFEQSSPVVIELTATLADPARGRLNLSLTEQQTRKLFPKALHPRAPVGYYDVFITSPSGATRYLMGGQVLYTAEPDTHQQQAVALPEHMAPWWMDGNGMQEPHFMTRGVNAFWRRCWRYLLFPLRQSDPLNCSEAMLNLLAWDRGIRRFTNEPLDLYRKRVKYAFVNARDAGETAGFKRIFERLGVGWVGIHERRPGEPWDLITIELSDSNLAQNQTLLQSLIEQYGRTCRRYQFEVTFPIKVQLNHGRFDGSYQIIGASL